jgi:hypothetical protein
MRELQCCSCAVVTDVGVVVDVMSCVMNLVLFLLLFVCYESSIEKGKSRVPAV